MTRELESYNEFLNIIEFPVKSHLLNSNDKSTLERYRVLRTQIETALTKLEYLEVENINYINRCAELCTEMLKHREKLEALEMIKEIISIEEEDFFYNKETDTYFFIGFKVSKEQYDLLRKVLLR